MKIKKQINTAKLKVKYVLGSYSSLSSYPDAEDVIFEFIRDYCGKVAKDIKFTNVSLQKKYDLTEERTSAITEKLMADGILAEINANSAYKTYEVIINPYE